MDNERKYCVYMHKCPNGKSYIGITSQEAAERWRNGEGYKNQMFYRAIQKYGWDKIEHSILFTGLSKEEAEEIEIEFILKLKTNQKDFGYNISNGGNSAGTHSEETKRKIAQANTGRQCSEETRAKISARNKGKIISEETKSKISNTLKGREFSEEHKRKISEGTKGRVVTKETREKISKSKTGQPFYCKKPCERSEKISKAMAERNFEYPEIMGKMREQSIEKCSKKVIQIDIDGNEIAIWKSAAEIERVLKINHVQISRACKNKGKIVNGYLWQFYDKY